MKILHVVRALQVGGLERVVVDLVDACRKLGDEVWIACLHEKGVWGRDAPDVMVLKGASRLAKARELAVIARAKNIDIMHSHNPEPQMVAALSQYFHRTAFVHTKHGRNYPGNWRRVWMNRWLHHRCDATVAVSHDAATVARNIEHCAPQKLHVIHNGINTTFFQPIARGPVLNFRHAHGIDERAFVVGSIGRLSPEKNYAGLIEAIAILRPTMPALKFVLVGDGPEATALQQKCKEHALEQTCIFAGEQDDIRAWVSAMDVFVLNSTTEGLSMTLLEACACGVVPVVTDVGGNREIVESGQSGLVVPSGDIQALCTALQQLYADPGQRRRLAACARDHVTASFSQDVMVAGYKRLYNEVLS